MSNKQILGKFKAKRRQARLGKLKEKRKEIKIRKEWIKQNKSKLGKSKYQSKYSGYNALTSTSYGFIIPTKKPKLGKNQLVDRFLEVNKQLIEESEFGTTFITKEERKLKLIGQIQRYRELYNLTFRQALVRLVTTTYEFKSAAQQGPINFIEGLKTTPCHDYEDNPIDEYSSYEYACYLLKVDTLQPELVKFIGDNIFTYDNKIQFTLTGGKGESQYYIIERI